MFKFMFLVLLYFNFIECVNNGCNVRKCCPEGYTFQRNVSKCINGDSRSPMEFFKNCEVKNYGKQCPKGYTAGFLDPTVNEAYRFSIETDGALHFSKNIYNISTFCLEIINHHPIAIICVEPSSGSTRSKCNYTGKKPQFITLTVITILFL